MGSVEREIYEEGVRFACWGMAMYSLSCSCYSFIIERLVKRFKYECKTRKIENFRVQSSNNENFFKILFSFCRNRARQVYMGGQLIYTFGIFNINNTFYFLKFLFPQPRPSKIWKTSAYRLTIFNHVHFLLCLNENRYDSDGCYT